MAYRLAIADTIVVPIRFTYQSKEYAFELHAKRESQDAVAGAIREDGTVTAFLRERVSGWKGQTLVIDNETDKPADFSAEAFDALLSVHGLPQAAFTAYLEANSVKAKAKN